MNYYDAKIRSPKWQAVTVLGKRVALLGNYCSGNIAEFGRSDRKFIVKYARKV